MDRPATSPIRLCVVVAATDGLAAVIATLGELRRTHGYEIAAVVGDARSPFADRLRDVGATVHEVPFDFAAFPASSELARRAVSLAELFRRERFDVVITCLWQSMLIGRLAGWLADVPARMTRVAGPFHLEAPLPRWIDGRTCGMDHRIIGVCRRIVDIYREMGVRASRLKVLYPARDLTTFGAAATPPAPLREELNLSPDTPLVGMVSWFYPPVPATYWSPVHLWGRSVKGHETYLAAAAIVLRERPGVRFVCVGGAWGSDGDVYMTGMRSLARDLHIDDRVFFLGPRSDIAAIYRALDVAAHPSRSEATGGAVESLLMKCPTVASRTGGLVDLVQDRATGVLANVDDPADLARGILDLLGDRSRAAALTEAGHDRVVRLCDAAFSAREVAAWVDEIRAARGRAGYRLITRAWRRVTLRPFLFTLTYGLRLEEARSRIRHESARDNPSRSLLNLAALIIAGPEREHLVAGWIRQRVALARGWTIGMRHRWRAKWGYIKGTFGAWLQRVRQ